MVEIVVLLVFWGVVLGLVVTPFLRRPDGARWLHRWGLGRAATTAEDRAVSRHIRVQRAWTIAGFLVAGLLLGALRMVTGFADGLPAVFRWTVALLLGLLLGELVTVVRQRGRAVRTASLLPRPSAALVAGWARWTLRAGTALVVLLLGVVEVQTRWWDSAPDALIARSALNSTANVDMGRWPVGATAAALGAVLTLVVVETVVHLAVTRPSGADITEDVDLLLRTRAARVATGAGLGLTGFLLSAVLSWSHARVETLRGATDLDRLVMVWANTSGAGVVGALLIGALTWIYAANPPARSVLATMRTTPAPA